MKTRSQGRLWLHRAIHPVVTAQILWGLSLQFAWPVTMFSPRRRQIIRDERAQPLKPWHVELRAELDRRRLGLPSTPDHYEDP